MKNISLNLINFCCPDLFSSDTSDDPYTKLSRLAYFFLSILFVFTDNTRITKKITMLRSISQKIRVCNSCTKNMKLQYRFAFFYDFEYQYTYEINIGRVP